MYFILNRFNWWEKVLFYRGMLVKNVEGVIELESYYFVIFIKIIDIDKMFSCY